MIAVSGARGLGGRRVGMDRLARVLAVCASALGVALLAAILATLVAKGWAALSPAFFLLPTASPGQPGGMLNAMVGSLMMSALGMAVAMPMGILAGIHLAEYGRAARSSVALRFLNDILLSAPSICIGMFVYEILVRPMRGFSGYAGACALAIIALPVIVRTTEDMLALVPDRMREAASALGAPRWHVIVFVCSRLARSGIVTGVLLAASRIVGETAPLLFTALNNQYLGFDLGQPTASMTVTIFHYAMSPYDDWHDMAWGGALVVTFAVLAMNIAARALTSGRRRI